MPFTFSHPAAAVPFARFGLPLSALVVGSMSPDFLYFLTLETQAKFGHTVPGLFLFCLPAGLVVLWTFHRLLKRPLLEVLPAAWQRQLAPACVPFSFGPARRFVLVSLALVIGAATHIIWDGLTHSGGWAVQLVPWLSTRFEVGLPEQVPVFRIMQHVSTIAGALLLALWTRRWARRNEPMHVRPVFGTRARLAAWVMIPLLGVIGAVLNGRRFGWIGDPYWMIQQAIVQGVVGLIAALFVGTLVLALAWTVLSERRSMPRPVEPS